MAESAQLTDWHLIVRFLRKKKLGASRLLGHHYCRNAHKMVTTVPGHGRCHRHLRARLATMSGVGCRHQTTLPVSTFRFYWIAYYFSFHFNHLPHSRDVKLLLIHWTKNYVMFTQLVTETYHILTQKIKPLFGTKNPLRDIMWIVIEHYNLCSAYKIQIC